MNSEWKSANWFSRNGFLLDLIVSLTLLCFQSSDQEALKKLVGASHESQEEVQVDFLSFRAFDCEFGEKRD